jgi:CBS domain-containing protein
MELGLNDEEIEEGDVMKVSEIMTTDVKRATPDNTLMDIAAMMRDEDVGALPVVQNGELRGIVTDRDIVVRAIAEGNEPSTTTVQEVLSEELASVAPDADVEEAADLMASHQIRRLPVVQGGKLIGIVTLGDIAVKHEESTASHALEGVSEGVKASWGRAAATGSESLRTQSISARGPSHKSATKSRTATRKKAA